VPVKELNTGGTIPKADLVDWIALQQVVENVAKDATRQNGRMLTESSVCRETPAQHIEPPLMPPGEGAVGSKLNDVTLGHAKGAQVGTHAVESQWTVGIFIVHCGYAL
jgi:hypothetical protein